LKIKREDTPEARRLVHCTPPTGYAVTHQNDEFKIPTDDEITNSDADPFLVDERYHGPRNCVKANMKGWTESKVGLTPCRKTLKDSVSK
jgi:hypothetical protein